MWRASWGLIVLVFLFSFSVQAQSRSVLPFSTWKKKKISEAQSTVTNLKRQVKNAKLYNNLDEDESQELRRKLYQSELNLGLMKELSGNDYLVLYIFPTFGESKQALAVAAKSLGPTDTIDVLTAYRERLQNEYNSEGGEQGGQSNPIARFGIGR